MITAALLLVFFFLFLLFTGYAIRDAFRQAEQPHANPVAARPSRPVFDNEPIPPRPAVASEWTTLDDIQLARVLLGATRAQQLPMKSNEAGRNSEA